MTNTPTADAAEAQELVLRVIPMPADTHLGDQVAGSWMLSKLDSAGSVLPMRITRARVVLVGIEKLAFTQPVKTGDLVSFYAKLLRVGSTSVSVRVRALTERRGSNGSATQVTEAVMTYVAIDEQGAPVPVARAP
ncbi:acyl-CoA thioesterase [Xylophilus sp. ASV27]|uniref:acyl-CoA thioesterase n=1 Tax=Xylophilus sp. ASV27 TaxID=2795129 RepID=UPI0018EC8C41|nr:hotdog domain-containing protein [Xylophilus sp. ASV27]